MSVFTLLMVDDDGSYTQWIDTLIKYLPDIQFHVERIYDGSIISLPACDVRYSNRAVLVLTAQSAQQARHVLMRLGAEIHAVFVDMTFTGEYKFEGRLDDEDLESGLQNLEHGSLNLDGFRLAHLARERNPRAFIAIITGQAPGDMMERPQVAATYGDIDTWISKGDMDASLYFAFKQCLKIGAPARSTVKDDDIVGDSAKLRRQLDRIPLYAAADVLPVLITGETGTGKEGAARAIHGRSGRANKPFVTVNCTALVETLAETELFGHEKGAFTNAVGQRLGAFESADGGTLFLDEIGDMPLTVQSKLLRTLEAKNIQRVGSMKPIAVDVRIIAATNADLESQIKNGSFRRDLYHRINVLPLVLPPLRERGRDVQLLAIHFLEKVRHAIPGVKAASLSRAVVGRLECYDWPGNIRELKNMISRAAVLSGGAAQLQISHFPDEFRRVRLPATAGSTRFKKDAFTKDQLAGLLSEANENRTTLAQKLGCDRKILGALLKAHGLGSGRRGRPRTKQT